MRVLSVNVGTVRAVEWAGKMVQTGIFKHPVSGPVAVRSLNVDGDAQADLRVHGGLQKAVYAYPSEHYPAWQVRFAGRELPWGTFGENLTTAGIMETTVHIGDVLRIGSVVLRVTQPRRPCVKLAEKLGDPGMIQAFLESCRSGFYCAVVDEGVIQAGDTIAWASRDPNHVTVDEMARLQIEYDPPAELLDRAKRLEGLPEFWRKVVSGEA